MNPLMFTRCESECKNGFIFEEEVRLLWKVDLRLNFHTHVVMPCRTNLENYHFLNKLDVKQMYAECF